MLPMLMRALFGEDLTALRTAIGVAGRAHGEVLSRRMPAWRRQLGAMSSIEDAYFLLNWGHGLPIIVSIGASV